MKHSILFAILIAMNMHPAKVASDLPPVAVQQVSSPGRSYFYSGETVTFSAAGSYDQDEDGYSITYYEWYVDGAYKAGGSSKRIWTTSFSVSSGQTTVHIKLKVRDDENPHLPQASRLWGRSINQAFFHDFSFLEILLTKRSFLEPFLQIS